MNKLNLLIRNLINEITTHNPHITKADLVEEVLIRLI